MGSASLHLVCRRRVERGLELPRQAGRGGTRRQGCLSLGRRAGRGNKGSHVLGAPRKRLQARERPAPARNREGRPSRDLHGDGAGASDRHARVRPDWCAARRRLRRLLRRVARRAAGVDRGEAPDHTGRGLAQGRAGAAQGERRCRRRGQPHDRERDRVPADRLRRGLGGSSRRLVARRGRGGVGRVPAGEPERRGHALPPAHVRDDCQAQGRAPHRRRVSRARLRDAQMDLRHPRRHRLVVRRRRGLDHRAQLHRVRAPEQRRHERSLRGRSLLPRLGPPLGDRGAIRGQLLLHGADPHPLVRQGGSRISRAPRPLLAPAPRARSESRSIRRPGSGTGR